MKYIKKIPIIALLVVMILSTSLPVYAKEAGFTPFKPPNDGFTIPTPKPKSTVTKKSQFPKTGLIGSVTNPKIIKTRPKYNTTTWKEKATSAAQGATSGDKFEYTRIKSKTEEDLIVIKEITEDKNYTHIYLVTRVADIYVKGKKVVTNGSSTYQYSDWKITGVDTNGDKITGGFKYKTKGKDIGTGELRSSADYVEAYFYTPGIYTITTVPYMKQSTGSKETGYGVYYYRVFDERFNNKDFYIAASESENIVSYSNTSPAVESIEIKEDYRVTWTIVVTADMVVPPDPGPGPMPPMPPPLKIDPKNPSNIVPGEDDIDVGINE